MDFVGVFGYGTVAIHCDDTAYPIHSLIMAEGS